jgi:hypothetical protein
VPSIVTTPVQSGDGVATRDVFSDAELAQLRGFPEINRVELIRYSRRADARQVRRRAAGAAVATWRATASRA